MFAAKTAGTAVPLTSTKRVLDEPNRGQPAARKTQKLASKDGPRKVKQTKSRNGCVTCKAKRMKCDEQYPTCQQCARRGVQCGGYQKHFKWKPIQELNFIPQPCTTFNRDASSTPRTDTSPEIPVTKPKLSTGLPSPPPSNPLSRSSPDRVGSNYARRDYESSPSSSYASSGSPVSPALSFKHYVPSKSPQIPQQYPLYYRPNCQSPRKLTEGENRLRTEGFVGRSPTLKEMLLPGTDLSTGLVNAQDRKASATELHIHQEDRFQRPIPSESSEDDVEEIAREIDSCSHQNQQFLNLNGFSTGSGGQIIPLRHMNFDTMFQQPKFAVDSPEMLLARFDRQTCGIMSIKDGPTENPWRTLIRPMIHENPWLYHSIASMACFHSSKNSTLLRLRGIEHVQRTLIGLRTNYHKISIEVALAATLGMAYGETWDCAPYTKTATTGIDYVKAAKGLIVSAIVRHRCQPVHGDELQRLKFLCKTWIYIDVLARLTSDQSDDSNDFEAVAQFVSDDPGSVFDSNLDPLMGCGTTLFLILGKVANLIRRTIRESDQRGSTSNANIAAATRLRNELTAWHAQSSWTAPEDATSKVADSLQTAEAYRWATLLYLHQAVPEMLSLPSRILARRTLSCIAAVPLSSRAIIVQIYPLVAAGSEAIAPHERRWVVERWDSMADRMLISNVDRCADVVKEVWYRRGGVADGSQPGSALGFLDETMDDCDGKSSDVLQERNLDHEFSAKGKLHWLSVMRDWNWEVFLG